MPTCNQIQINPNAQIRYITNTNTEKLECTNTIHHKRKYRLTWSHKWSTSQRTNTLHRKHKYGSARATFHYSSHWHASNPHGNRLEMSKLPNWNGSDTTILMQASSCLPFTWVCPGLGLRSITFACVCVPPSVSITLCVSPVCPSPACFERPASKYLALYTLKAFLWGQSSFRNPQTKQRKKHNQDKNAMSYLLFHFLIHCQSGYTFNSGTSSRWWQDIHEADQS